MLLQPVGDVGWWQSCREFLVAYEVTLFCGFTVFCVKRPLLIKELWKAEQDREEAFFYLADNSSPTPTSKAK